MSNVTVQEALKAAIDWFDNVTDMDYSSHSVKRKLQMALSELDKCEPVAEIILDPSFLPALRVPLIDWKTPIVDFEVGTKLYDKPQPHDWVGLTYKDKVDLRENNDWYNFPNDLIEATEAKCKQLNTKG